MLAPFVLSLAGGGALRGDVLAGAGPGYLYLHGLGSVRTGEKSTSLLQHAARRGRACLRIDQRGHGESSGRLGEVTIGELVADVRRVLAHLGPQIVVGSSLGGLVAAFAAAAEPHLVRGLCLLAPALGFTAQLERHLDAEGRLWTSEGRAFVVERRVLDDAAGLDERGLPACLSMPTLLVHGTADDIVPPHASERFVAAIAHPAKDLWLVPGGDHRLNTVADAVWPRLDRLVEGG
ncbi:MAG: alpha/beta fold hydrolase [Planctomycetes bacterium]|nr:alpha/beta fold hydrolase [Planctomycetota bacterium]